MSTGSRSPSTPRAAFALLLCTASLGLAACKGAASTGPRSKLALDGTPSEASVLIDEQPIGSLAVVQKHGVSLPPGQHRLTVQADGYFPADLLIDVDRSGGVVRRTVKLTALPEP